ncbi:N-acetylmuramidase [Carnobacterium divergens]|uniref:Glycoside hydrolase family 73 protein n=1 Tax=Carnobacterium divergens TaxID=2748 RepID=A0AAW8RAV2_CARDV|nr:glycoside hydrolase family 73 protein [Carnobacterium divergens]ANZ99428.1 N-acetylmuramidase [Carnobacterium divergens]MDT1958201.1 glycoside hydrolase family 73 protein [Carnobacterium divergens]MDT1973468.1 glycoside hydrolase family 73 protein [Carnobacterium divergens]MDT1995848.1 glycoside hydrolase family 73 protein [Carnobacterium divergens]MDT2011577.1 glycoside hydrolase family 73 protein [Carnobacterium divergens]
MLVKKKSKFVFFGKKRTIFPSYIVASLFIVTLIFFGTLSLLSKVSPKEEATVEISQEEQFIQKIASHAQVLYQQYQVLPSISISQAILESDWGTSELSTLNNNFYGIKGTDASNTVLMTTKEFENGQWIEINARFRKYEDWKESMEDHAKLFVNGTTWNADQYATVRAAKNYQEAAHALQASGYATDPDYPAKLIELIQQYKLDQYDQKGP